MNRRAATGVLAAAAAIASLTGAPALADPGVAADLEGILIGASREGSVSGFVENEAYRLDASCSVNTIAPLFPRVWRTYDGVAHATPKRAGNTAGYTTVRCRGYDSEQAFDDSDGRNGRFGFGDNYGGAAGHAWTYGAAAGYNGRDGGGTWNPRLPLTICVSGEVELSSGRLVLDETCTTLPPWSPAVRPVP